jgi:hypothetical protein
MFTPERPLAAAAATLMQAGPSVAENGKRGTCTPIDTPPTSA